MKIYDRPGFPNPSRIRIVLAEKGLDPQIEFISVDLIAAEHKQAAFLAKNPLGRDPGAGAR
jgi:glutathione S-transferase